MAAQSSNSRMLTNKPDMSSLYQGKPSHQAQTRRGAVILREQDPR